MDEEVGEEKEVGGIAAKDEDDVDWMDLTRSAIEKHDSSINSGGDANHHL